MNISKKESKLLLACATIIGSLIAAVIGSSMNVHNHNHVTVIVELPGDKTQSPSE